jgi:hypothetical protein
LSTESVEKERKERQEGKTGRKDRKERKEEGVLIFVFALLERKERKEGRLVFVPLGHRKESEGSARSRPLLLTASRPRKEGTGTR